MATSCTTILAAAMAICRCSRILSQIESAASRMIKEAAIEMSSGVSNMGFMAFPAVPPPFDSVDPPGARPGLHRGSPAGRISRSPFVLEAAPRPWRPTPRPMGQSARPEERPAGPEPSDLASLVSREVLDHGVGPPTGFGGDIGRLASPFRRRDGGALCPIQPDLAFVGIEVGDHAKKQAFARSRRAGDGGARAGAEVEVERAGELAAQLFHHECGLHRISCLRWPASGRQNSCTTNHGFRRYRVSYHIPEAEDADCRLR